MVLGIHWNIELSADPPIELSSTAFGKREVCPCCSMSSVNVPKVSLCWNAVHGDGDACRVNRSLGKILLSLHVAILIFRNENSSKPQYEIADLQ
jgi:hypothetical protein